MLDIPGQHASRERTSWKRITISFLTRSSFVCLLGSLRSDTYLTWARTEASTQSKGASAKKSLSALHRWPNAGLATTTTSFPRSGTSIKINATEMNWRRQGGGGLAAAGSGARAGRVGPRIRRWQPGGLRPLTTLAGARRPWSPSCRPPPPFPPPQAAALAETPPATLAAEQVYDPIDALAPALQAQRSAFEPRRRRDPAVRPGVFGFSWTPSGSPGCSIQAPRTASPVRSRPIPSISRPRPHRAPR